MTSFLEALKQRTLLGDGAMGTQLQQAGLVPGGCGEAWNIEAPEKVTAIQRGYVEAGSDCLITNTFGGSRIMLERYGYSDRTAEINAAAVRVAREAFGDRPGYVIGDMGPFGGLLEPFGEVRPEDVRMAFREQAEALVGAGADAIIIETQTSLEELGIALECIRAAGAPCVIASMAFDVTLDGSEARTMMGIEPEQGAQFMVDSGADVVALNCGTGIDMLWAGRIAARYRATCDVPIMVQPNAGTPVLEKLEVIYKAGPEVMAAGFDDVLAAGVNVVGGCCGSTPAHIRRLRELLDSHAAEGEVP